MPSVPIATFLAGSLLSLLLPTLLLIALVVWYVRFIERAPGPAELSEPVLPTSDPASSAASASGGGTVSPATNVNPGSPANPGGAASPGPNVSQTAETPDPPTPGADATGQS